MMFLGLGIQMCSRQKRSTNLGFAKFYLNRSRNEIAIFYKQFEGYFECILNISSPLYLVLDGDESGEHGYEGGCQYGVDEVLFRLEVGGHKVPRGVDVRQGDVEAVAHAQVDVRREDLGKGMNYITSLI